MVSLSTTRSWATEINVARMHSPCFWAHYPKHVFVYTIYIIYIYIMYIHITYIYIHSYIMYTCMCLWRKLQKWVCKHKSRGFWLTATHIDLPYLWVRHLFRLATHALNHGTAMVPPGWPLHKNGWMQRKHGREVQLPFLDKGLRPKWAPFWRTKSKPMESIFRTPESPELNIVGIDGCEMRWISKKIWKIWKIWKIHSRIDCKKIYIEVMYQI